MDLAKIYTCYVADVVSPLVAEERRHADLPSGRWKEDTLGFFYRVGTETGYLVETNSETVRRVDPQRYERDLEIYREEPKEYLVDLRWREGYGSGDAYRIELALEVEWTPIAPAGYEEEDLDEDLYKLLDVKATRKVGILGCAAREIKHLSRQSEEDVVSTFATYVSNGPHEAAEYLLLTVDHDESVPDSGIRPYHIDGQGNRSELEPHRYA